MTREKKFESHSCHAMGYMTGTIVLGIDLVKIRRRRYRRDKNHSRSGEVDLISEMFTDFIAGYPVSGTNHRFQSFSGIALLAGQISGVSLNASISSSNKVLGVAGPALARINYHSPPKITGPRRSFQELFQNHVMHYMTRKSLPRFCIPCT